MLRVLKAILMIWSLIVAAGLGLSAEQEGGSEKHSIQLEETLASDQAPDEHHDQGHGDPASEAAELPDSAATHKIDVPTEEAADAKGHSDQGQSPTQPAESEPIVGQHDASSAESATDGLVWFGVVFVVLVSLIYLLL